MAKILVIDDDELICNMISAVLRRDGHEVDTAINGTDGVAMAKADAPEIVITDILMPEKEGVETIMELQANNPYIKIIAISGGGRVRNMTFLEMAKKVGARHILEKPFRPAALMDAINDLLDEE